MQIKEIFRRKLEIEVGEAYQRAAEESIRCFLEKVIDSVTQLTFVRKQCYEAAGGEKYKSSELRELRIMELGGKKIVIDLNRNSLVLRIGELEVEPETVVASDECPVPGLGTIIFEQVRWEEEKEVLVGRLRIIVGQEVIDENLDEDLFLKILQKLHLSNVQEADRPGKVFDFSFRKKKKDKIPPCPSPARNIGVNPPGKFKEVIKDGTVHLGDSLSEMECE